MSELEARHRDQVDRYLDDLATPEEAAELSRLMETRPEVAAYFAETSQLQALLHEHETSDLRAGVPVGAAGAGAEPAPASRRHPARVRGPGRGWTWGLAAAGLLVATLGLHWLRSPRPRDAGPDRVAGGILGKGLGRDEVSPPDGPRGPQPPAPKAPEPGATPPPQAPVTAAAPGPPPDRREPPSPEPQRPARPEEPPRTPDPPPDAARPQASVAAVCRIDRLEGEALVTRRGVRVPAKAGQDLLAGESVETTGAHSWALLGFADGTRVELWGQSTLREISDREPAGPGRIARGRRFVLDRGTVVAEISKQPPDQPTLFVTPRAQALVVGTTLRLAADPGRTRLEVSEGKVRFNCEKRTIDVPSGHYAVAAAGVEFAARPTLPRAAGLRGSRALTLVRNMPPNSWVSAPLTKMRKVVPDPAKHPKIQGEEGPASIVNANGSGVLDTVRNRLILWGGGIRDYYGNEIYAFRIDELAWERVTEPTLDPKVEAQVNADGTPCSRSPYNGLAYIEHADRFFALGGEAMIGPLDLTWTFDFAAKAWKDMKPGGTRPPTWHSNAAAYDPHTRRVWWAEHSGMGNGLGLYSYDIDANTWSKHNEDGLYHRTAAVDTRRRLLVFVGEGEVSAYDLGRRDFSKQVWKTQGGDAFLSSSGAVGLDYDSVSDRIVGWNGGAVYALDPETKVWTAHAAPRAPAPSPTGIFGRWRYVPSLDAFIAVTSIDEDVRFYKLPRLKGR